MKSQDGFIGDDRVIADQGGVDRKHGKPARLRFGAGPNGDFTTGECAYARNAVIVKRVRTRLIATSLDRLLRILCTEEGGDVSGPQVQAIRLALELGGVLKAGRGKHGGGDAAAYERLITRLITRGGGDAPSASTRSIPSTHPMRFVKGGGKGSVETVEVKVTAIGPAIGVEGVVSTAMEDTRGGGGELESIADEFVSEKPGMWRSEEAGRDGDYI